MSRQTNTPYHPAGSVPTPVLIAKKIAENQSGGTANFLPSLHHLSVDEKPSTDHPVKQGPPTSAKPTHYPDNINMIVGSKDRQNQPPPNVSIQEKQAHMLANLGMNQPLLQDDSLHIVGKKPRNVPTRKLLQPEHNSYGGRSRNLNPVTGLYRTSENPARSSKPPAPTPAPRPPRHIVPQKPATSLSADNRRRSNSMFRPQGITVQFSGRGEMNESRREALRKLGLLKKS
uniref:Proline and serine rich 2 n=1 Tax=Pundamilia nyererei TaxID=303518 RepID=A0A3B4GHZ5_9CICH